MAASSYIICLLGSTASGKTRLAVSFALRNNASIISADSRQVYRGLDIGAGKDLEEYQRGKQKINYYLIDRIKLNEEYNLYRYQQDVYQAIEQIASQNKVPLLCGGSGMYLSAALDKFQLTEVPIKAERRSELEKMELDVLVNQLKQLKEDLHNSTDILDKQRVIRAIEIAEAENKTSKLESPIKNQIVFGIDLPRDIIRQRIKDRLDARLENGMIEEVKGLINEGVSREKLWLLGLEYRYITLHLEHELSYSAMYEKLLQAIRRFAKKQMTWFRRMEKRGTKIHWLDGEKSELELLEEMEEVLSEQL